MTPREDSQREIRSYLLGGLHPEAGRRVEERLLTEDAFMEELVLAEEELIDDYVARRLSAGERADFERHFLSTEERRRQLRFAQALGRYADAHAPPDAEPAGGKERRTPAGPTFGEKLRAFWGGLSPAGRGGLALAASAVVVLAVFLARAPSTDEPRTFYTLALAASAGDRAGGVRPAKVPLPLGADALMVTLKLPEGTPPAARYSAELLREGRGAGAAAVTAQDARGVTVVVPAAALTRGQYALRLTGVGADGAERRVPGSYFFDAE